MKFQNQLEQNFWCSIVSDLVTKALTNNTILLDPAAYAKTVLKNSMVVADQLVLEFRSRSSDLLAR